MNLNRVILIGRLTADPDTRMTTSGTAVANFRMATNRYYTDKSGTRQEQTEFHSIVTWARTAEVVRDYLKQGQIVMVEGRLQTRSWETKEGQKRWTTEIVADQIQLGPKAGAGDTNAAAPTTNKTEKPQKASSVAAPIKEEDIPVIDEDTVMNFDDEAPKQVDPKDIPF